MTRFQQRVLRLAAVMAAGVKKTGPTRYAYAHFGEDHAVDGPKVYACALGAAFVDGKNAINQAKKVLFGGFSVLDRLKRDHPVLKTRAYRGDLWEVKVDLAWLIVRMNDVDNRPRASIVAWLRRLAKLPAPPVAWSEVS